MSKRFTTVLMAIFTGMFFLTVGILTAADVPKEILIENSYAKDKKGPVKFYSREAPCGLQDRLHRMPSRL